MSKIVDKPYRNELLREAKEAFGKSDAEIAREAGVSRPTVIAIMKGDPNVNLRSIQAVAKTVRVKLSALFAEAA